MKDKYRVIYQPHGAALEYSPMALNLYDGCESGCDYCFVPGILHQSKEHFHSHSDPRKQGMVDIVRRDLLDMQAAGDKRPILLCFICDPYPKFDALTRFVLELFHEFNHPFQVLTKGGMRAARDFDLYKPDDAYAATLTCMFSEDSMKREPGAALPFDRIESLYKAKKRGITTWVSFEPVLNPDDVYNLYEITKDAVDLFKIGKLNHQASDVDWRAFGMRMIEMCERDRKAYLIKDALAKYLNLPAGEEST